MKPRGCPQGKGRSVGSGKLADHSDFLQVQDLVSFTHHAFDKLGSIECQIAIIKTHTLSSYSHFPAGKMEMARFRGSQMGQISEVRRSLVDI